MSINRTLGVVGSEKGDVTENLFVRAVMNAGIAWVKNAVRSKKFGTDDRRGVDVTIETDVGNFYFQIKSSQRAARLFKLLKARSMIVLVVYPDDNESVLAERFLTDIGARRKKILQDRQGSKLETEMKSTKQ